MRPFILIVVLLALIVCLAEGSKKDRKRNKQHRSKSGQDRQAMENLVDDDIDDQKDLTEDVDRNSKHKPNHKSKAGSKVKHHKKEKFDHKQQLTWLNINKDSDCGLECKTGEICITGPVDSTPLCVLKKDLKKSMKMFHRYQKKEMKAWKQFQKEYHNDDRLAKANNGVGKKNEMDIAEIKNQYLEAQNLDHQKDIIKEKTGLKPFTPTEAGDPEECSTSQFSQMRTRLMGWFHLLHGQDHIARKAHDGNIKHFYKHVSVKKELREHQGNKCMCLKSAMWQFLQMDKDGNDNLNDSEISILKDNSLEPCMQPYLTSCDHNADGILSSSEWCCCFSNIVAPCFKKVDEIRRSGEPVTYMPRCDKEGYYMREQCNGNSEKSYNCWCVDYNGNEYKGTRTNGRAHCNSMYGKPQST